MRRSSDPSPELDDLAAFAAGDPGQGQLATTVMDFTRTLRSAGLPVGPGQALAAIESLCQVGLQRRDDVYAALHAVLVRSHEEQRLFDQAFHIFFRNPRLLERMMSLLLPPIESTSARERPLKRLAEALAKATRTPANPNPGPEREGDASSSYSANEVLQHKDFEQMSLEELAEARQLLRSSMLIFDQVPTRRFDPRSNGSRIDLRTTMRKGLRQGGEFTRLYHRERRRREPPLVLICDISGSMTRYSRMFLHFAHVMAAARTRVHTFVFATRLSNITRSLRARDVDRAVDAVAAEVDDWAGGTRIAACLRDFNLAWSRRVLAQGAIVVLLSDGLDRGDDADLRVEAERLQKSCRRLVWLNPLLRYAQFQPRARGVRSLLPFVDDFRPAHNLASLGHFAAALSASSSRSAERRARAA